MGRFTPPSPADAAAYRRTIQAVSAFFRGNCPCGKWLVLSPKAHTPQNPHICSGPCHSNIECGHTYWYENGKWKGSVIND